MKKALRGILTEALGVTLGVLLTAAGLDMFLIPQKIAAGGVSGIATVLYYLMHAPVGLTMLVLNIPLFVWAFFRLGWRVCLHSMYGTVGLSLAVDILMPWLPVPTHDPLLGAVFGGVVTGLGLGIVFRYHGTTGGTELLAAILRTYTGANVGQLLFLVDAAVVLFAGLVFKSYELALYALIAVFVTAWLIDIVQEGFSYAKAFLIISDHSREIAGQVLAQLDRGATALQGRGMYTGREREVLLVVVSRSEVTRLKDLVRQVDPRAFVILADVHEVLGEGFKPLHEEE
ncbi:MAG: YitT family protein [Desulfurispora sp.]|uniref:YitT family protein n=1 Tax=Desulfurispora sp. TaxID=3014275 RepID=UPI004048EAC0